MCEDPGRIGRNRESRRGWFFGSSDFSDAVRVAEATQARSSHREVRNGKCVNCGAQGEELEGQCGTLVVIEIIP